MIYLDTSALLPLFRTDVHSPRARAVAAEADSLAISDFAVAELSSSISASVRNRELTLDQAGALLAHVDSWAGASECFAVTTPVDIAAAITFVRRPDLRLRAPDAIHLAICRRVGATLLTFDADQTAAAEALGIPLVA